MEKDNAWEALTQYDYSGPDTMSSEEEESQLEDKP